MLTIFAKVKKKSRIKKTAKKVALSKKKKVSKKKSIKRRSNKTKGKGLASRFKIDQNNWIVFYYAAAYIGIFGLFALAIYYSN